MKQLTTAYLMYLDDYDGLMMKRYEACGDTMPLSDTNIWANTLQPYIQNRGAAFLCPSGANSEYGGTWATRGGHSIGYNRFVSNWYYFSAPCKSLVQSVNTFQFPSRDVLFADTPSGATEGGARGYLASNEALNDKTPGAISLSDRHHRGANIGFLDGHVKWYRATALLPGDSDAAPPCGPFSLDSGNPTPVPFQTGLWYFDTNAAGVKWVIDDYCTPA